MSAQVYNDLANAHHEARPTMTEQSPDHWRDHGVRIVSSDALDMNTPHHPNAKTGAHQPLACVLVRSGQDPVVVNLDLEPAEPPEDVAWVDSIHPEPTK